MGESSGEGFLRHLPLYRPLLQVTVFNILHVTVTKEVK